ncbi:MAG: SIS domain-containing protein [bacterium]
MKKKQTAKTPSMDAYHKAVAEVLDRIARSQRARILKAAEIVTDAIARGGILHVFGSGHSHMIVEEMYSRAGGLVPVNPILEPNLMLHEGAVKSTAMERLSGYAAVLLASARTQPHDSLIIVSNSGRNAVPIEMALEAKKHGLKPIAVTSVSHSKSVLARHPSGKRLFEICDVVIDNCGAVGDASTPVGGRGLTVGPTSTIASSFIVNCIAAQVAENLIARNLEPPVFISGNLDGSDFHNYDLINKYSSRIRF